MAELDLLEGEGERLRVVLGQPGLERRDGEGLDGEHVSSLKQGRKRWRSDERSVLTSSGPGRG